MAKENFFASNLKYLRTRKNMEQQELAELLNRKSGSTVSDWERGKFIPRSGTLTDLAEIFNVELDDLLYKDLTNPVSKPSNITPIKSIIKIPRLGKIACGEPITAIENIDDYKEVPEETLPAGNVEDLFFLTAQGDSMEPKIPNGSDVLCKKQADVESGDIAAVLLNGDEETTLKKVIKQDDGTVILQALNESYAPYVLNENNPGRIVGKAIRVEFEL